MSDPVTAAMGTPSAVRGVLRVFVVILASAAITACGEASAPNADEATEAGGALAKRTQELRNDVRRTARELVEDPAARANAIEDLRAQESEARKLADRIRSRLPENPGGDALARANEGTATAASRLERFARSGDAAALEEARAALEESQSAADAALEELGDRIPPDTRDQLEDLRRKAPDIPKL